MFAPEIYVQRRTALREALSSKKGGIILLPGNQHAPITYRSNYYPFRQDACFLYFFGLDLPSLGGIIDLDDGTDRIFGDDPDLSEIVWTGPQITLKERADAVGIKRIHPIKDLQDHILAAVKGKRPIYFLPPYRGEQTIMLASLLDTSVDKIPAMASEKLIQAVVALRSIKGPEEVEELDTACRMTNILHATAMSMAAPGVTEQEIFGALAGIVAASGSTFSFNPIVSVNGAILHNEHYHNELEAGQLLLVDAGATSPLHYAGDMTRVTPVSGSFTDQQREIYQIVLDALKVATDSLKPGVQYKTLHLAAARKIVEGLKDVGLMKGDPDAAVAAGAHALFFPHGLGHMMGLEVHDMEGLGEDHVGYAGELSRSQQFGLAYLRLARTLQTGFVLTVEPGIYFIPELIDQWESSNKHKSFIDYKNLKAYRDFGGIRIEDDYLITLDGARLLGDEVPKGVEEIEAFKAG